MTYLKQLLVLFVLIFFSGLQIAKSQNTQGSLEVYRFSETTPTKAIAQLQTVKSDTARINLLLKISSIYWRAKSANNSYLDSCLYFAKKAMKLSASLHNNEELNESTFLTSKALIQKEDLVGANQILQKTTGEQHVRLLLVIAEHYSFLSTDQDKNLAKAIPYIKRAIAESQMINSVNWKAVSQKLMAKTYFLKGDIQSGKQLFFQIINDYRKLGDKANEASYWNELAIYLPRNQANYELKVKSFKEAANLYNITNDKKNAGYALLDMGDYVFEYNLDSAVTIYIRTIKVLKEAGEKNLSHVYLSLTEAYEDQGNPTQALTYALLAMKNLETLHNNINLSITYVLLGNIYRELEEYKQSTFYYKSGLELAGTNARFNYIVLKYYADGLVKLNQSGEALKFINKYEKIRPTKETAEEAIRASALANSYKGLGDLKKAEQYYLQMIRLIEIDHLNKGKQIFLSDGLGDQEAYYELGQFYSDIKNFKKASGYLQKAATYTGGSPMLKQEIAYLQFQSDSASGNYAKAIIHYEKSTFYKDSIHRAERLKELIRMRVEFETVQKEKDLKILEKEGLIQKKDLKWAKQQRVFTYAGLLGLLLLLIVVYNRYRLKQKSNLLLQEQKNIIDSKNSSLVLLVQEKEWLLKEVHHRVKNNLQIITSLLNSQSKYLNDVAALNAIADSQHRVRAMSLIHQKLYMVDNTTAINMSDYLHELITYLKDSFKTELDILFDVDISPITIDLAYAVPIGLIVNEVVTNAIKHAFPQPGDSRITIKLSVLDDENICLTIADNGIGLPLNYDIGKSDSFGMVLIKGMVEDLNGELVITNDDGTKLSITFNVA